MLWTPTNEFTAYQTNWTDPINAAGVTFVPGINDAKGSWTDLLAGLTSFDSWGIYLNLHDVKASGQIRPLLADIGVDVAGGVAYTVRIPNLNAASAEVNASFNANLGGYHYFFPMFIPAGSRIAARGQVGHATASDCRVKVQLFQKPTQPEVWRTGSFVDALGIDLANSRGTTIVPGLSNAEGAWVSLGAVARDAWWIQPSMSMDGTGSVATQKSFVLDLAIGSASDKRIITRLQSFGDSTSEAFWGQPLLHGQGFSKMPAGSTIYARAKTSASAVDAALVYSAMAYLLGG